MARGKLVHAVHTGFDLAGYSRLDFGGQRDSQQQLYLLDETARSDGRVDHEGWFRQYAGDGHLTRWPPDVQADRILADYLPALLNELNRKNKTLADGSKLRLRVSIVLGTSEEGPGGLVGPGPIWASRLLDSKQARQALKLAPEAPMVVIVDDSVYQAYIKPGIRGLRATDYVSVTVDHPEKGFSQNAWISVPGSDPTDESPGSQWKTVASLAIAAIAIAGGITAALISTFGGDGGQSDNAGPSQTTTVAPPDGSSQPPTSQSEPETITSEPGQLWTEVAANHRGTPTFSDNSGAASDRGSIPFGTEVQVKCVAENLSGMASINAFYVISGGTWDGTYAPANTFANGDVLGSNGSTDVDPNVPPCGDTT